MPSENKPNIVDSVLEKARQEKQIDLTKAELSELAGSTELLEKATLKLETKDQLKHLVTKMKEERIKQGLENKSENPDQGLAMQLEDIEQKIDAHASAMLETVQIESPEVAAAPKTFIEKVKNFFGGFGGSMFSPLVRGWISVQRTLISLGIVQGNQQQLDAIEKLYGKWFGATEAIDRSNTLFQGTGIETVKDKKDGSAYFELKKAYLTELDAKLLNKTPELQAVEREQFTFENFLDEKVGAYAKAHAGKLGRTTLTGILKNQRPAEVKNS